MTNLMKDVVSRLQADGYGVKLRMRPTAIVVTRAPNRAITVEWELEASEADFARAAGELSERLKGPRFSPSREEIFEQLVWHLEQGIQGNSPSLGPFKLDEIGRPVVGEAPDSGDWKAF